MKSTKRSKGARPRTQEQLERDGAAPMSLRTLHRIVNEHATVLASIQRDGAKDEGARSMLRARDQDLAEVREELERFRMRIVALEQRKPAPVQKQPESGERWFVERYHHAATGERGWKVLDENRLLVADMGTKRDDAYLIAAVPEMRDTLAEIRDALHAASTVDALSARVRAIAVSTLANAQPPSSDK